MGAGKQTGLTKEPRFVVVPGARLELAQAFAHHPLKMACLPVPPSGHVFGAVAAASHRVAPIQS